MHERTRLIAQATRRGRGGARPVNPPIERGTTLLQEEAAALHDAARGPLYGLEGATEAHLALREALAELEGAHEVFLLPSGLAAVTVAILAAAGAGDEVLAADSLYGPTRRFLDRAFRRLGGSARYFPTRAPAEEAIGMAGPRTRAVLLETPGSLTFELPDTPGIARLAAERGLTTLIDSTWAAGVLFKPLARGVDLSVQALSKYVGGHADLFMGSVAARDAASARRVAQVVEDFGWYVTPDDAYVALRGLRTLPVRLAAHEAGGLKVARWLEAQPEVISVLHPALPSSPDHAIWKRDFTGAASLFGVVLREGPESAAHAFLNALELFGLGFSWGGFESLATYDAGGLARRKHPVELGGRLVRLHVGLEDPDDLIADLRRGLDAYAEALG